MNKSIEPYLTKNPVILLLSIWFLVQAGLLGAPVPVRGASGIGAEIWSSGSARGAYLVMAKALPRGEGFQIFFRENLQETLIPGKSYQGKPLCVSSYENRLLVFLDNGGSQSYGIETASRTEPRVPAGLLAVAANVSGGHIYVLTQVQQSTEIELEAAAAKAFLFKSTDPPDTAARLEQDPKVKTPEGAQGSKPDGQEKDTPEGIASFSGRKLQVQAGDYYLFIRGKDNQWRSLSETELPIADWERPTFTVTGDVVYLFGIEASSSGETSSKRSLLLCRLEKGQSSTPAPLPIDNVVSVTAFEVNRQLRVIAAVAVDEGVLSDVKAGGVESHYRMGRPTAKGWEFSAPLQRTAAERLSASPERLTFAVMEQNLAVFERRSETEVVFGIYDSSGKIVQDVTQTLVTERDLPGWLVALTWYFSPQVGLLLMALVFLLVFRRRLDFLSELPNLPAYVQLGSLSRRSAAAFIDLIPAWIAAYMFVPINVNQNIDLQGNFWQESQLLAENPELFKFLGVFYVLWIGYLTLSEILFSTSPGKLILQLIVLTETLTPLSPKEALWRNFVRILEFHVTMLFLGFFLALISRRRQRLGDLLARSIVVTKTPELQNQIMKMLQKNYFRRQESKDSDSQDNSEDPSQEKKDD